MITETIEILSGSQRRVLISINKKELAKLTAVKLHQLAKKVKIDGFRRGKVPPNIMNKHYGFNARYDALFELIDSRLKGLIKDSDLRLASKPEIENSSAFELDTILMHNASEDGGAITVPVLFEIFPDVAIADLSDATIEQPICVISDNDIEEQLNLIRSEKASYQNSPNKCAAEKDEVVIDFVGTIDGKEFAGGSATDYSFLIGYKYMLPEFENAIIGKKSGDEFTAKFLFPTDYVAEFAGKEVEFTIKLKAVNEPVLPEIDEKFLNEIGFKEGGVNALRARIKAILEDQVTTLTKRMVRNLVFDLLINRHTLELPAVAIENERKAIIRSAKNQLRHYYEANNLPYYDDEGESDVKSVTNDNSHEDNQLQHLDGQTHATIQEEAIKRITYRLLIDKIRRAHDLQSSDEEIGQEWLSLTRSLGAKELADANFKQEVLMQAVSQANEQKVINHVLSLVQVKEQPLSYQELLKQSNHMHNHRV